MTTTEALWLGALRGAVVTVLFAAILWAFAGVHGASSRPDCMTAVSRATLEAMEIDVWVDSHNEGRGSSYEAQRAVERFRELFTACAEDGDGN